MKTRTAAILSVISVALGFFLGRVTLRGESSVETKETVKYVLSERVVRDTIEKELLVPYETFLRDTIVKYLTQKVDTSEILKDYFLSRKYSLDFSNDSIGTYVTDIEVSRNELISATSIIRPIVKVVYKETTKEVTRIPMVQFYGMLGSSVNLNANKVSFGVDLRQKYLLGVSGIRFDDKYSYSIDFGIKF